MKNRTLYGTAVLLLFLAAGCAVTDVDRAANFYDYKTYAWGKSVQEVDDPAYKSELVSKNIQNTIEDEFARRGIKLDKSNPDFFVSYHTYTKEKREIRNRGYGYYPYVPLRFYRYYYSWGFPYAFGGGFPEEVIYTEGTLIIDITDSKTKELVWRGTVKGKVDDIAALQKQIQKGIRAIMKKYPVTPQEQQPIIKDEKVIS